ncbi:MAG: hypothetical protein GY835_14810 [bacterium]|nr:hypothetical protein [bacterium]
MRKLVIVIAALLLFASCGAVQAQYENYIGMFGDPIPEWHYPNIVEVDLNQPRQIYILAILDMYAIDALTGAEFSIPDMPEDLGGAPLGSMSVTWATDLVIVETGFSISLAWQSPQPGPVVLLGTVELTDFGGYLFDNLLITFQPHPITGNLGIVDDEYEYHDAYGFDVILNTVIFVPSESNTWSGIKSLY